MIGGTGFIGFVRQVASDNNDLMLKIAAAQAAGTKPGEITTAAPVALTALAPLAFVVGTPLGWLSAYLFLTGMVRSIAGAVREPLGDPIVALVRVLAMRLRARRHWAEVDAEREALAGPEVADRIASPERFGLAACDLVIVASRPKEDWTPGTILDCGERWLTVGEPVERALPQGLRVLYPLTEARELEVFRRVIPYALPPLAR